MSDKKTEKEEMLEEVLEELEADAEAAAEDASGEEPDGADAEVEFAAEEEAAKAEPETADTEKKGFFKKKKDKKDEQIEELNDKVKRQMAEFDNFRKRTEKEKSHMYEIGAKDVIDKILPVVDNFERGLGAVKEEEKEDPFVQGMEMVYKQLMSTLEGIGVKPIEAAGQEFNPDFHNAVMHVDDDELGENIVVEELQKGYMYRDSVVRHSMVKVAN